MNISRDIKPVTYLKSRAADLLKQINRTHRPVVITQNGEPKAVLQDPKSYENMRNAIGILKLISQGEKDIKDGNSKSQEEVFADIENVLKERMKSPLLNRVLHLVQEFVRGFIQALLNPLDDSRHGADRHGARALLFPAPEALPRCRSKSA